MPIPDNTTCAFATCQRFSKTRGYCSAHYHQRQRGRELSPLVLIDPDPVARFWAKVNRDGPTMLHMESPCWVWTGAENGRGYGRLGIGDVWVYAHRHSFILANGPLPEFPGTHAACVLHRCDNPPCVRPDHLFLGTQRENLADMMRKGRANQVRGERTRAARLTDAQVREIRTLYAAGILDGPKLAGRFGVDHSTVYAIINRRTWRHLP